MTRLRLSMPGILLLGLAALLVFGNCGGVRWMLYSLTLKQEKQLRHIRQLDERARRLARQQHGAARQQALTQALAARQQRLDSLKLNHHQRRKVQHRWRKIGRQLPIIIMEDSLRQLHESLRQHRADSLRQLRQPSP